MKKLPTIQYAVFLEQLEAHVLKVVLTVSESMPVQRISMPVWIPGSYKIRDYAKHIIRIEAKDTTGEISLEKVTNHCWQCSNVQGKLTITYWVYAFDRSVRGAHVDTTHAFMNGCCIFLAVEGRENEAVSVILNQPASAFCAGWQVATSLSQISGNRGEFGQFIAKNYDELIDHPIELGTFDRFQFDVAGCQHDLVITGKWIGDIERLLKDLKTICAYEIDLFGKTAPMSYYLFLLTVTEEEHGGLEHCHSTALLCSRYAFPKPGIQEPSDAYQQLLALFSHEYFHLWNVKRIKPKEFIPYDLTKPNHTKQLWIYEGFTAYYDELILLRSKVIHIKQYLHLFEKNLTRFYRTKGRGIQSVAEASFDAWIKLYQPTENSINAEISYYNKGALIAFCLDIAIRKATNNQRSLDDLMCWLWDVYGKTQRGTEDGVIEEWLAHHVEENLVTSLRQWVYGTGELPIAETFALLGIEFTLRQAATTKDLGGYKTFSKQPLSLGLRTSIHTHGMKIDAVITGSPAEKAGLAPNDLIIAMDSIQVNSKNYQDLLDYRVGDQPLIIHAFRDHVLMQFHVIPQVAENDTAVLRVEPKGLNPIAKKWMNGESD
jgi:predicted metalloprotease with PDZ domain